jgi:3-hydroxymyristoyl/3-hydroxydecanoyl-(acyl carrier protein) dehydratase
MRMVSESARRNSTLHGQFLQMRQGSLQDLSALIAMQIHSLQASQPMTGRLAARQVLFDQRQIKAFGTGKISDCFGPGYARYDQRRIPRIPNGDLSMMSRIVAITGRPHEFDHPASIVAEYDVPADAWYLRDNAYPQVPASLYMEIALQPCGFLSAYLDSYALVPYEHFYFRNLDGNSRILASVDARGKTIQTEARMLSSVVSGGTVIQKFAFKLSCEGQVIIEGESLFGYFSAESMDHQLGLDGGRLVLPEFRENASLARSAMRIETAPLRAPRPGRPYYRLPQRQLSFLDQVFFDRTGGRYGRGYVYARRPVRSDDWFYACHFYQDPVMPGSLGIEAILEAMQAAVFSGVDVDGLRPDHFGMAPCEEPVRWRYRGQITPLNEVMELEVHLGQVERKAGGAVLTGDASLWVDSLRIYEINHIVLGIFEG